MQNNFPKSRTPIERSSALSAQADCAELPIKSEGVVCRNGSGGLLLSDNRLLPDHPIDQVIACPDVFIPQAKALQRYGLIISLDFETEQNRTSINKFGKEVPANTVLSCQYAATYQHANGSYLYAEGILYLLSPTEN